MFCKSFLLLFQGCLLFCFTNPYCISPVGSTSICLSRPLKFVCTCLSRFLSINLCQETSWFTRRGSLTGKYGGTQFKNTNYYMPPILVNYGYITVPEACFFFSFSFFFAHFHPLFVLFLSVLLHPHTSERRSFKQFRF